MSQSSAPNSAEVDVRSTAWYPYYRHTVFGAIKSALNQGAKSFALVQIKPQLDKPWTIAEWPALQEDVARSCRQMRHQPFFDIDNDSLQISFDDILFQQERIEDLDKQLAYLGTLGRAIIVCSSSEKDALRANEVIRTFNERNTTLKVKVMTAWASSKDVYRLGQEHPSGSVSTTSAVSSQQMPATNASIRMNSSASSQQVLSATNASEKTEAACASHLKRPMPPSDSRPKRRFVSLMRCIVGGSPSSEQAQQPDGSEDSTRNHARQTPDILVCFAGPSLDSAMMEERHDILFRWGSKLAFELETPQDEQDFYQIIKDYRCPLLHIVPGRKNGIAWRSGGQEDFPAWHLLMGLVEQTDLAFLKHVFLDLSHMTQEELDDAMQEDSIGASIAAWGTSATDSCRTNMRHEIYGKISREKKEEIDFASLFEKTARRLVRLRRLASPMLCARAGREIKRVDVDPQHQGGATNKNASAESDCLLVLQLPTSSSEKDIQQLCRCLKDAVQTFRGTVFQDPETSCKERTSQTLHLVEVTLRTVPNCVPPSGRVTAKDLSVLEASLRKCIPEGGQVTVKAFGSIVISIDEGSLGMLRERLLAGEAMYIDTPLDWGLGEVRLQDLALGCCQWLQVRGSSDILESFQTCVEQSLIEFFELDAPKNEEGEEGSETEQSPANATEDAQDKAMAAPSGLAALNDDSKPGAGAAEEVQIMPITPSSSVDGFLDSQATYSEDQVAELLTSSEGVHQKRFPVVRLMSGQELPVSSAVDVHHLQDQVAKSLGVDTNRVRLDPPDWDSMHLHGEVTAVVVSEGAALEALLLEKTKTTTEEDSQHQTKHFPNGDRYVGPLKDDKMHGYEGTYYYANGEKYVGPMKEGKRHGDKGTVYRPDGSIWYVGPFKENQKHGAEGTYYWADGRKYVGPMKDGKHHGDEGTWYRPDGSIRYVGPFKDNRRHGEGLEYDVEGKVRRGRWEDGRHIEWLG
eukprot:TRINITY_DN14040_c0_g1_i7.p1 TRINITY_DN14040_c0_g1~~TRINITY_DN14040_c0_g1_i7.p1  ORF type:complete len:972 (-),score=155.30 TRINITY_DN14040_c0_g1_i7:144-3059(-)